MSMQGYDHWKTTEPEPQIDPPAPEEPTELDLVYGELHAVQEAGEALVRTVQYYYDVDDGIPNIPGDIMIAVRRLEFALSKIGKGE